MNNPFETLPPDVAVRLFEVIVGLSEGSVAPELLAQAEADLRRYSAAADFCVSVYLQRSMLSAFSDYDGAPTSKDYALTALGLGSDSLETELQSILPPEPLPPIMPVNSPILGFLGASGNGLQHLQQNSAWTVVAFFAIFAGLFLGGTYLATRHDTGVAPPAEGVAQITMLNDCRWAADGPTMAAPLPVGRQLALDSGTAEVTYATGAKVLLVGPARYVVLAENAGQLDHGCLLARAYTNQAHGFTITTPAARVLDLGTEFSVEVRGADTEVYVSCGAVAATALSAPANAPPIAVPQGFAYRFQTGSDKATAIAFKPALFGGSRPVAPPPATEGHFAVIKNPSFESPVADTAEMWIPSIADWQNVDFPADTPGTAGVRSVAGTFTQPCPDGKQVAYLNEGELRQQLAERLAPRTRYELTFWVGNRSDIDTAYGKLASDFTVELLAGDTVLASQRNPVAPEPGHFAKGSLSFTASDDSPGAGQPLTIVFHSNGGLPTHVQNHIDQVSLEVITLK